MNESTSSNRSSAGPIWRALGACAAVICCCCAWLAPEAALAQAPHTNGSVRAHGGRLIVSVGESSVALRQDPVDLADGSAPALGDGVLWLAVPAALTVGRLWNLAELPDAFAAGLRLSWPSFGACSDDLRRANREGDREVCPDETAVLIVEGGSEAADLSMVVRELDARPGGRIRLEVTLRRYRMDLPSGAVLTCCTDSHLVVDAQLAEDMRFSANLGEWLQSASCAREQSVNEPLSCEPGPRGTVAPR